MKIEYKFDKIKKSDQKWPMVEVNEQDKPCLAEFTRKMDKTTAIDLSELILKIKSLKIVDVSEKQSTKTTDLKATFKFFDDVMNDLVDWRNYFKKLKN